MKRLGAAFAALLFLPPASFAQTLPELFQKAKEQVRNEAWQEALTTLDSLAAEAAKEDNQAARQPLAAPTVFYRAVCEANLGQAEKAQADFATFLQLEPNASMDPSMYSKKAIAAFDAARKALAPATNAAGPSSSMFTKFQEFKLPPNASEQVNDNWAEGPIQWIMTAEEKRSWSELLSPGERQEFVEKFWEARNPRPGNPDNPYRTAFERRVAYADANFVQAERTRGSMTDRGMVFVLLGPPTYVGRRPIRTGEDATEPSGTARGGTRAPSNDAASNWREVWHYRKELLPKGVGYQQVDFEFITRAGYGVNVLQRDPATLTTLDAARVRKVPPAGAPQN